VFGWDLVNASRQALRKEAPNSNPDSHRLHGPFAGFSDWEDCTSQHSDASDPDAYCGKIYHQVWKGRERKGEPLSNFQDKESSRKHGWTGWGPSQVKSHPKVAGWDWNNYLEAYERPTPGRFACSCGEEHDMPGHHECKCGRLWNGYVIGTGGSNHEAAAEKYLVREIMTRPDMIVASITARPRHEAAGDHEATEDDWPTEHHPKTPNKEHKIPGDWAYRSPKGRYGPHPMPRRPSPQTQPAQL